MDFSILHPRMRTAVDAVISDLKTSNIPLFVFEAFRRPERQAHLFAQGRTRPGKKVTFAEAWGSFHQYGLAVDFVFGGPGRWTWDEPKKGMWKDFHLIGERHGLMRLDFETPHLQLAGLSSNALKSGVYPQGGDEVWAENLRGAIRGWKGKPAAPPPPKADGTLPRRFLAALALPNREGTASVDETVAELAMASPIAKYDWEDRGVAFVGYTKGMAVAYGKAYRKLKAGDPVATFMAKKATGDAARDALDHYDAQFKALGMKNDKGGADTLRHLFVLLLGLGMRESSGRYCEGRDMSTDNKTGEKAEAGLFQTSFDAIDSNAVLAKIYANHLNGNNGLAAVFSEGVRCKPKDWKNWGSGPGVAFQKLSKELPYFAVELAAAGLRCLRKHWGPINNHAAELKAEADTLLRDIQGLVDAS